MLNDPWSTVRTRHNFQADEVISALQKEIRRGNVENAALLAYEMFTTSHEMEEMLWRRLQVCSVEDVGWGNLQAPLVINALYQFHNNAPELLVRGMFAIHAVRYLATQVKDRSSDEMYAWIRHSVEEDGLLPTIPDYAIDVHTARGVQMGRDRRYFYEESAKVFPELQKRETTYYKRLLKMLDKEG